MREIKFRVWDKNKEEFIMSADGMPCDIYFSGEGVPLSFVFRTFVCTCDPTQGGGCGGCTESCVNIDYDPENHILLQYTGLKDWNDKDIYEGDILSHKYSRSLVVVEFGGCGFTTGDVSQFDNSLEIVGNIYENPELVR